MRQQEADVPGTTKPELIKLLVMLVQKEKEKRKERRKESVKKNET